jgi:hypothetical protein
MKKFDLNIEKVLENWEVHHALDLSTTIGVRVAKEEDLTGFR